MEEPFCKDGTSQTETNGPGDGTAADDIFPASGSRPKISRLRATFVEVCVT